MKRTLLMLGAFLMIVSCNKSAKEAGTYSGVLPCGDCEGIQTEIVLNPDYTYSLTENYMVLTEVPTTEAKGKFVVDDKGIISLDTEDFKNKLVLEGGNMKVLDTEGKEIMRESHLYDLKKAGKVYEYDYKKEELRAGFEAFTLTITLNDDKTYTITEDYKGVKPTESRFGEYTLSESGALTLKAEPDGYYRKLKMVNNKILVLDDKENVAKIKSGDEYMLPEVGRSFYGVTPCADCPGIETTFRMDANGTYKLTSKYQDREGDVDVATGKYSIKDNVVKMEGREGEYDKIRLYGDKAVILDMDGNENMVTNENYILKKK